MLGMCWGEEGVLGGRGRRRRRIYSYNGSVNKSFIVPGERIHNRLPSLYFWIVLMLGNCNSESWNKEYHLLVCDLKGSTTWNSNRHDLSPEALCLALSPPTERTGSVYLYLCFPRLHTWRPRHSQPLFATRTDTRQIQVPMCGRIRGVLEAYKRRIRDTHATALPPSTSHAPHGSCCVVVTKEKLS